MPIPTYDKLLRPVLEMATRQEITRQSASEAMAREFKLSPEEKKRTIPSGQFVIRDRTGWAMSFLTKGKLISKVAPRTYRVTEAG